LAEREREWLERLTTVPASFAAVELEVHEQARRQADLYVAGLLAKASEQAEAVPHIDRVIDAVEVPLCPAKKKDAPWWSAFNTVRHGICARRFWHDICAMLSCIPVTFSG
jgi:hypothetical protein